MTWLHRPCVYICNTIFKDLGSSMIFVWHSFMTILGTLKRMMMIDDDCYKSSIILFLCGLNNLKAFISIVFVYIIIYTHTYIIEMSRCVLSNSPTVQIHYLPLWATCLSEVKETWIYIYIYNYSFTSRYHCCVFVDGLMTFLFFQEDFLFYL